MNWNAIVRDGGRVLIGVIIVGGWVYCVITGNPASHELREIAVPLIAGWLAVEGVLKYQEGKGNGRYYKGE